MTVEPPVRPVPGRAIRAVTFDADGTLFDVVGARQQALQEVVVAGAAARPELAGRLVASDLQAVAQELFDEAAGTPTELSGLRRRSFHVALTRLGVEDPALADALADRYVRHQQGGIRLLHGTAEVVAELAPRYVLGVVTNGNTDPGRSPLAGHITFRLAADVIGIAKPDPRVFHMAAVAAGCRIDELVHVGDRIDTDVAAAQEAGARAVWVAPTGTCPPAGVAPDATIGSITDLPAALAAIDAVRRTPVDATEVGVGPHPRPWPDDDRLDPDLLTGGDRRNVVDRYRYWRTEAVVADLDRRRHPFHVAVENWRHDLNIGTVVRNANAFLAAGVHIVGRRRWNRRGAMVTDRYQRVVHHPTIEDLVAWANAEQLPIVAVDNLPGARPLDRAPLPERCVLLFGQEGPGLSDAARAAASSVYAIRQFGSTRSINAGVASGIAMHAWIERHAADGGGRPGAS